MAQKRTSTIPTAKKRGKSIVLDFDAAVVPPDIFKQAIDAFIELLNEVSGEAVGSGKKIQWNMGVAEGSTQVIARPVSDVETARSAEMVMHAIPDGLRRLKAGTPTTPAFYNDRALRAAKQLGEMKTNGSKRLDYIKIHSVGRPCDMGEDVISSVINLLGGQHQALGSIEGKLETITVRGQPQFVVYDSLYDKGVNCFVDDALIGKAIAAFQQRVAVSGMIQYNKEGRPVSIHVDAIRIFKDASELPPIHKMRGIFVKGE